MTLGFVATLTFATFVAACGHSTPAVRSPHDAPAPVATPKEKASVSGEAGIDAALRDAWKRAGVTPAPRADDATFLRRVYVDIVGSIPPPDVTTAFLASDAPDKRKKIVDTLLASPAYAEHWMNYWDDVLMGRETRGQDVDRLAFRYWLRARFAANSPWDRVVRDLVSATGQNSTGGQRVKLAKAIGMQVPLGSAVPATDDPDAVDLDAINGAVNWTLRFEQTPQDLAGSASRIFLGVQIQCAQCHDHKTEKWTQNDFRRFTSAFLHARTTPLDKGKPMGNVKRVNLDDFPKIPPRFAKDSELSPIASAHPTALDGTDLEKGSGTRKALAEWMTSPKNPWFAKAIVNRMWGHMLGRGFYDPIDDMRASNEPVMVELLDRIASDFVAHDFDLEYLIRTIAATEAYQLSARAPASSGDANADPENKLWSHFHLAPLGPEELLNALLRATNVEAAADKAGIKDMDQLRAQLVRQYAFLFDVDETDDTPDFSGTVTQALSLLNGALVGQGSRAIPGSALSDVLAKSNSDEEKIDELALRVLGRKPTSDERAKWVMYVQTSGRAPATIPRPKRTPGDKGGGALGRLGNKAKGGDPRREAYEDLFWAWLNSSEFVFNH